MLDRLSTSEKRMVKEKVSKELKRYRIAKEIGEIQSVEKVERAIEKLPEKERFLIKERYTHPDSEYTTDQQVYSFKFSPVISAAHYNTIRSRAMVKLALALGIDCGFDLNSKINWNL
ncbi:hypothetical protein [Bacillus suaedae]|uniref:ArpU family transcriptional regulator n=1 Tax=Halalkalibacter suaedae TaxID=2822140 RepID=A0A940X1V8_9BACI|nr:hypothetical protein [Bacillus suaedae]MBP3953619.1 hypothetical protein [Bacillus suaedae]